MKFWRPRLTADTTITATHAARLLGELGRDAKAKRTAMLTELRREVRECTITPLGWKA